MTAATTSTQVDAEDLRRRVRDLLAAHDPQTTDRLAFLRARFDAGLAWVHYPVGLGGLDAPRALQAYETLRRKRCARVQRSSRINGARYDATGSDLADRDRQLSAQPQERAWIWNYDAELEAMRAIPRA